MRKLDIVLVAVRYAEGRQTIEIAQGYERFGQVWTDIMLYDRAALADRLAGGALVVTGRPSDLAGEFEVFAPVALQGKNGAGAIAVVDAGAGGDDLGLPLF
jgi:hypothetical protein